MVGPVKRVNRSTEKLNAVLLWLSEFGYSTQSIMSARLGVDPRGQIAFYSRLVKQGYLKTVNVTVIRESLYVMTPYGKDIACGLTESAVTYCTESSRIRSSLVVHSLSVQMAVVRRVKTSDAAFQGERALGSRFKGKKAPDALVELNGERIAIEAELSYKSIQRIYTGFLSHAKSVFKDKEYGKVVYVFPNALICKSYENKFLEPEWPLYKRDKHGKLKAVKNVETKENKTVPVDNQTGFRESFEFVVEDCYPC